MPKAANHAEAIPTQPNLYTIHVQEHLSTDWSEGFEGLAVSYTPSGETLLSGPIADQSALHGVLARIRDLNLTLIAVMRSAKGETHEK